MAKLEIGPAMLWRLGYRNLTRQQAADALHEIYEALQMAVGTRLAAQMNPHQLEEFERLVAGGPEERALAWLNQHLPNYRGVVADEFDTLQRRLEGAIGLARRQARDSATDTGSDR